MKNEDSLLDDAGDLLGTLLLGAVLLWALKLLFFAYMLFAATFWALLRWLIVALGVAMLRTYNFTRRLFS